MSIADDIRQRLEKLEFERTNPYIRLRCDELRALLDELYACEDENDALLTQLQAKQK